MAVHFVTASPKQLLEKFIKAVAAPRGTKDGITTWIKSDTGDFYTHAAANWKGQAWFKPTVKQVGLTFDILPPKGMNVSLLAYGYYHGHLIETFLNHFDLHFASATASAAPTSPDKVTGG